MTSSAIHRKDLTKNRRGENTLPSPQMDDFPFWILHAGGDAISLHPV